MPAEPNLLQKVDALLNRHRNVNGSDADSLEDFPVLTDVIELAEIPPSEPVIISTTLPPLPSHESVGNNASLSDVEAEILSRDIFQHVLAKLSTQISNDLHNQLTDRLSSIIDNAVAAAIEDFKQELANTIGDGIAEALLDRADRSAASQGADKPENVDR
ncbi:MAG: hypothetical protein V4568_09465 [Pseudomonadota bacterium]